MLLFRVKELFFELAGVRTSVPVLGQAGTYVHARQPMSYGFDVQGLTAVAFPVIVTVGFDIEYDNVPPIRCRGTKRVIRHTFNSFRPMNWSNLIIDQDEYDCG